MLNAARLTQSVTCGDGNCLYYAAGASVGVLSFEEILPENVFNAGVAAINATRAWVASTRTNVVQHIDSNRNVFKNDPKLWPFATGRRTTNTFNVSANRVHLNK